VPLCVVIQVCDFVYGACRYDDGTCACSRCRFCNGGAAVAKNRELCSFVHDLQWKRAFPRDVYAIVLVIMCEILCTRSCHYYHRMSN